MILKKTYKYIYCQHKFQTVLMGKICTKQTDAKRYTVYSSYSCWFGRHLWNTGSNTRDKGRLFIIKRTDLLLKESDGI